MTVNFRNCPTDSHEVLAYTNIHKQVVGGWHRDTPRIDEHLNMYHILLSKHKFSAQHPN